jgi:hypothetical protein
MPRIEIVPENWDNSPACKQGDGTPTVDVCHWCADNFTEGHLLADDIDNGTLPLDYPNATVGSVEVTHPPYEECDYSCEVCGKQLKMVDD